MQPLAGCAPAILVLSYLRESRCRVAQLPGARAPTAAVTFELVANTLVSELEAMDGPALRPVTLKPESSSARPTPFALMRNKLRVRRRLIIVADHM